MARPNTAVLGMAVAGVLFTIAGAIPAARGDEINTVLFVLAFAFFMIAFALHKKSGAGKE
jgi:hypothetical protein